MQNRNPNRNPAERIVDQIADNMHIWFALGAIFYSLRTHIIKRENESFKYAAIVSMLLVPLASMITLLALKFRVNKEIPTEYQGSLQNAPTIRIEDRQILRESSTTALTSSVNSVIKSSLKAAVISGISIGLILLIKQYKPEDENKSHLGPLTLKHDIFIDKHFLQFCAESVFYALEARNFHLGSKELQRLENNCRTLLQELGRQFTQQATTQTVHPAQPPQDNHSPNDQVEDHQPLPTDTNASVTPRTEASYDSADHETTEAQGNRTAPSLAQSPFGQFSTETTTETVSSLSSSPPREPSEVDELEENSHDEVGEEAPTQPTQAWEEQDVDNTDQEEDNPDESAGTGLFA